MNPILRLHYLLTLLFALLIISYPFNAHALREDKNEKLYIVADSTIYNYKTGVTVFEGHVKVDQGTSHITSDRLITKSDKNRKIQEAIATGIKQLAHYWTLPHNDEPEVHATATIIKFYPIESNVTLEKNVHIKQGINTFQGELIFYNRSNQTITVPAMKNGRAVIVYNPDK